MKIKMLKKLISIMCSLTMAASFTVTSVGAVSQKKLLDSNLMKRSALSNPVAELIYDEDKKWLKEQLNKKYKESYDQFDKYRIWMQQNQINFDNCECYQNLKKFVNELDRLRLVEFDFNNAEEVFSEVNKNMNNCIQEMENWKKNASAEKTQAIWKGIIVRGKIEKEAKQRIEQISIALSNLYSKIDDTQRDLVDKNSYWYESLKKLSDEVFYYNGACVLLEGDVTKEGVHRNKLNEFQKRYKFIMEQLEKEKDEQERIDKEQILLEYNKRLEQFELYKEWKGKERAKEMMYAGFHSFAEDKQWNEHVKLLEEGFAEEGLELKPMEKEFDDYFGKSEELLNKIKEACDSEEFNTQDVQNMVNQLDEYMKTMEESKNEYCRRANIQNGWIFTRLDSDFEWKLEEFNKQREEYGKWRKERKVQDDIDLAYYSVNQAEKQLGVIDNGLKGHYGRRNDENFLKEKGKFIDIANAAISEMKKIIKEWDEKEKSERETRIKKLLKQISELMKENKQLIKEKTQVETDCKEQVDDIRKGIENMKNELATFEFLLSEGNKNVTQNQIKILKKKVQNQEKQVENLQNKAKEEVAKMDKQIQDNNDKMKEYRNEAKTLIDKREKRK